ncbi:DUF5629 family protein [Pseudomonas fluorescens]|nr:DUF5629 family protein [Pseudomonas fluorescens]AIG00836.1 hypothetical protein HZ99_01030 [Pseudomonas fluorescens]
MTAATLATELATSDMLIVDGLHAFEFTFDNQALLIQSMDGRERKQWTFSPAQVQAATFDQNQQRWTLSDDAGEHSLVCLGAITGSNEDEEDDHADA